MIELRERNVDVYLGNDLALRGIRNEQTIQVPLDLQCCGQSKFANTQEHGRSQKLEVV